jgi:hypothetical protein
LFRLLVIALAAWLVSSIVLIGLFFWRVDDPGLAAVAIPFVAWAYGYVPGALVLLIAGCIQIASRRVRETVIGWALLVYAGPAASIAAVLWLPLTLLPLSSGEGDRGGLVAMIAGPLLVVLYIAGLIFGYQRRDCPARRAALTIMAPPLAGLLVTAAWTGVSVATSPELQHSSTIDFTVQRAEHTTDGLVADGTITLTESGRYTFRADYAQPDATWRPAYRITWLDRPPFEPGRYRCRMEWIAFSEETRGDPAIVLEVRVVTDGSYDPPVTRKRYSIGAVLTSSPARLTRVQDAGAWGLADASGHPVTPVSFDEIGPYGEGLFPFKRDGRWGYIDVRGTIVIAPRFLYAEPFSEGRAAAAESEDPRRGALYGYIDRSGAFVVTPQFVSARPFALGVADVYVLPAEGDERDAGYSARIDATGRRLP